MAMEKEMNPQAEETEVSSEAPQTDAEREETGETIAGETQKEKQTEDDVNTEHCEEQTETEEPAEPEKPEKPEKEGKGLFKKKKEKKDKKDEKIAELTDQVKRQMAEFDNFRKRTEKEKSQMFDLGARSVIEKFLPVIDNFERGLAQVTDAGDDPFVQGMEKIYKQLLQEMDQIGVKPIEAEGKEFDPDLHNAVMHCEDDTVGENIVVQELQKGYKYHDTVVRHSMVKVAN